MNENVKKVIVVVVAILALALAVYEGINNIGGPKEIQKEWGHGTPGHSMKDEEKADAATTTGGQTGGGDVAGK